MKNLPSSAAIRRELEREKRLLGARKKARIFGILGVLVLVGVLFVSVFAGSMIRMSGNAMTPTIHKDDVLFVRKCDTYERGDIIAFAYVEKTVIRRLAAFEGEWVDIDADGNVYVNNVILEEPYITAKDLGDCDIELPFQVPTGTVFVLADARDIGVDSRSTTLGCVPVSDIRGKAVFRLFPWKNMGSLYQQED